MRRIDWDADKIRNADAVVLLTDHDAFDLGVIEAKAKFVLDTRKRLSGPHVEAL